MNTRMTAASAACVLGILAAPGAEPSTYCNPMSLPGIPISRNTRDTGANFAGKPQHRELADPSLLVEGNTIYCYPSNDMAWKSTDGGATWKKIDIGVRDIGYAPTIAKHKGRYLLCAGIEIYESRGPAACPARRIWTSSPMAKGYTSTTDVRPRTASGASSWNRRIRAR